MQENQNKIDPEENFSNLNCLQILIQESKQISAYHIFRGKKINKN
jgi:hypothetical protein